MKRIYTFVILLALSGLLPVSSYANSYYAVASGKYSDPATWASGQIPPSVLGNNSLTVSYGVKLELDSNIILNTSLSSMNLVNSSIFSTTSNYIVINNGSINGAGNIDIDSMAISVTKGVDLTGDVKVDKLYMNSASVHNNSINFLVREKLYLAGGVNIISGGGTITLSKTTWPTIYMQGGVIIAQSTSTADFSGKYDLRYETGNYATDIELTGSGLQNIEVDVQAGNKVRLSSHAYIKNKLKLTSGELVLNGRILTFMDTADFDSTGTGTINSTGAAVMVVNTKNGLTGGLRFSPTANMLGILNINLTNNGTVKLGSSLEVYNTLDIQKGRLVLEGNILTITSTATVKPAKRDAYVATNKGGWMVQDLSGLTPVTYPVGSETKYFPANVTYAVGGNFPSVGIRVYDSVYDKGTTGNDMRTAGTTAGATWLLSYSGANPLNYTIEPMWDTANEWSYFNRQECYVSYYNGQQWQKDTEAQATDRGDGIYSRKSKTLTGPSIISVFDKNTLSVNNVITGEQDITIYPNPAGDILHIKGLKNGTAISIYNTMGQQVLNTPVHNGNVDIHSLQPGIYLLDAGDGSTTRFAKQ